MPEEEAGGRAHRRSLLPPPWLLAPKFIMEHGSDGGDRGLLFTVYGVHELFCKHTYTREIAHLQGE